MSDPVSWPDLAVLVAVLVVAAAVAGGTASATAGGGDADGVVGRPSTAASEGAVPTVDRGAANRSPALVAAVPNPVADGDVGEHVVVRLPAAPGARRNLALVDGESRVPLGGPIHGTGVDGTATGRQGWNASERAGGAGQADGSGPSPGTRRLVVAADPAAARGLAGTNVTVRAAPSLALSNAGERLRLVRNGSTVSSLTYEDAPEGSRLLAEDRGEGEGGEPTWRPIGLDPRSVHRYGAACATAFVLPDAPAIPRSTLEGADRRLLLAGYTFASERVARTLMAAARRGVEVRVLLDGDPVGEVTARQARLLDELVAAGIEVRLIGGPGARFNYHHPKYAVVDDRALVATENWKPAGMGGADSRGWGVRVRSAAVADDLAALFRSDAGGRDARRWRTVRDELDTEPIPAANGSYPSRVDPRRVPLERVAVLTAPGNAERAVVSLIDNASRRVLVEQPTVGGLDQSFVRACLRAARRGVRVRILLSGAEYAAAENRRLVGALNERAAREELPLSARVADPAGRFGKIHAKGLVVDDTAVVGSMNWNDNSARHNREVALALHGEAVAAYYARVFAADWDRRRPIPAVVLLAALVAVGVAIAVVRRRVGFDPTATPDGMAPRTTPEADEPAAVADREAPRTRDRGEPPPVDRPDPATTAARRERTRDGTDAAAGRDRTATGTRPRDARRQPGTEGHRAAAGVPLRGPGSGPGSGSGSPHGRGDHDGPPSHTPRGTGPGEGRERRRERERDLTESR